MSEGSIKLKHAKLVVGDQDGRVRDERRIGGNTGLDPDPKGGRFPIVGRTSLSVIVIVMVAVFGSARGIAPITVALPNSPRDFLWIVDKTGLDQD